MNAIVMVVMIISLAGFYFVGYRDGLADRAGLSDKPHVHRWGKWQFCSYIEPVRPGMTMIQARSCKSCGLSQTTYS